MDLWLGAHRICNLRCLQAELSNEMQQLITRKPVWNEKARTRSKCPEVVL